MKRTILVADAPTGRKVEGVGCAGMLFKGGTIRSNRHG